MSNNFTRKIKRLREQQAAKQLEKDIKGITEEGGIPYGMGLLLYLRKQFKFFDLRYNSFDEDHKTAINEMVKRVPDICTYLHQILARNLNNNVLDEGKWFVNTKEAELLLMLAIPAENEEVVLEDQEPYKVKLYGVDGNRIN